MVSSNAMDANNSDSGGLMSSLKNLTLTSLLNSKKYKELTVPVTKNDMFYKMNHDKRGYAVIFNHIDFHPELKKIHKFERRDPGTIVDCDRLQKTFQCLGFEVIIRDDLKLTVEKIESTLEEVRKKDFKKCDCLVIVVLSHGDTDKIFAWDSFYGTDLLIEKFTPDKCRDLAGKPKILVLNLCQGKMLDPGCTVRVQIDGDSKSDDTETNGNGSQIYRMPLYADFLFAYSTSRGFVSFRNSNGSCYIEALCTMLDQHSAETDILTLLTLVNRQIAFQFEANGDKYWQLDKKKQMPSFTSMLTRMLVFRPK